MRTLSRALPLALVLGACREEPALPTMQVERVVASLADADFEPLTQAPGRPVAWGPLAPMVKSEADTGPLPALVLPPPAAVAFELEPAPPGAVLRVALGADEREHERAGGARLSIELDGRTVADVTLELGPDVSREERAWRRFEVPVEAGGRLVLRSEAVGDGAAPERVGFGLLQVVAPARRARTLASAERPNVVLIVIDTLRADRLGCYGGERPVSPVLDALAERGLRFDTAYAATPWTWPSTASILTGLAPPEHGLLDVDSCYLAHELVTLAESLQDAGLSTAGFACNPLVSADKNFDQGFERWVEYPWSDADVVLPDVRAWLDELGAYRFFLYLHLTEPHRPYAPPPELAQRFAGEPPEGYSDAACRPLLDARARGEPHDEARLAQLLEHRLALYDAEIAAVDARLGELLDDLERRGLLASTVVAVTSDHGEEFAEHGMLGHGKQLYDESVRVPLILAGPGVPRGRVERRAVENRRLPTTLLALARADRGDAGAARPAPDLLGAAPEPEVLFFTVERGQAVDPGAPGGRRELPGLHGAQRGGLRAMWSPSGSEGAGNGRAADWLRLYDLSSDPAATRDLSGERRAEALELTDAIRDFWDAGAAVRPRALHGGDSATEMLIELGYIEDDH